MSNLADEIIAIRGERSQPKMAEDSGVSHRTISKLELGESVSFGTIKKIAEKNKVSNEQWMRIILGWFRMEIGEDDFQKFQIQAPDNSKPQVVRLFNLLNAADQDQILKTMKRREVLDSLATINHVWERIDEKSTKPSTPQSKGERTFLKIVKGRNSRR